LVVPFQEFITCFETLVLIKNQNIIAHSNVYYARSGAKLQIYLETNERDGGKILNEFLAPPNSRA
jgi:hypothetical protein